MIDSVPANFIPPFGIIQAAQTARDGSIAVREEFDAAMAKGTLAAWDLFIARHPKSALLPQALAERAKLVNK